MPEKDKVKPVDYREKIISESGEYVTIEGRDITFDLIADRQGLIEEICEITKASGLTDKQIGGVMFNRIIGSANLKYSFRSDEPGSTFLGLSASDASFVSERVMGIGRSTFTDLGKRSGYIQRKPCGMRSGKLPFYLSVPKKDFVTLQGEFGDNEDVAQLFINEVRAGEKGPITRHLEENWAVINGVLASFARTELTNGVRFAQLYKRVWGDYPTGQIPVAVSEIDRIFMPDGTIEPTLDVFVKDLQDQLVGFSTLKTRLLFYELDRLRSQKKRGLEAVAGLEKLKQDLDSQSLEKVARRFMDEDPFVQIVYQSSSAARLSFSHILRNADKYEVARLLAIKFGKNGVFRAATELCNSIVVDLAEIAGWGDVSINYPDITSYTKRISKGETYREVFGDWLKKVGLLNKELFLKITEVEVGKMSKSTTTVNVIGAALGNPVRRSNMIGGSPCDWDHVADGQPEYLPQANEPFDFDIGGFHQAVIKQGDFIDDDINHLCYLLGMNSPDRFKQIYKENYDKDIRMAKNILVESEDCDLDQKLREELLEL